MQLKTKEVVVITPPTITVPVEQANYYVVFLNGIYSELRNRILQGLDQGQAILNYSNKYCCSSEQDFRDFIPTVTKQTDYNDLGTILPIHTKSIKKYIEFDSSEVISREFNDEDLIAIYTQEPAEESTFEELESEELSREACEDFFEDFKGYVDENNMAEAFKIRDNILPDSWTEKCNRYIEEGEE